MILNSNSQMSDITYHYSLRHNWSAGLHHVRIGDLDGSYTMAQSNWLMKRWNEKKSQGNAYILSGLGIGHNNSHDALAAHIGMQADWETRQLYTYGKAVYYALEETTITLQSRIGIAPYAADFDDIHTWLILQADDMIIDNKHTITVMPVVRMFKDNILVELGSNFKSNTMLNIMIHF